MRVHTSARSVSRFVVDQVLRQPSSSARVLAVFQHACDLVTGDGRVIAVVGPNIGDGPLNIVVSQERVLFPAVQPHTPAQVGSGRVELGSLHILLDEAAVWDPRPNWAAVRERRSDAAAHLRTLRRLCRERSPESSFLTPLERMAPSPSHRTNVALVAQRAIAHLRKGWLADPASLREGARLLAGLGPGLTPGGDDFLAGLMLWAWVAHPHPQRFCRALVDAAAERTTTLSAAFLRAAGRGECSAAWHALLLALAKGDDNALNAAATSVLSQGATSGADAVAGFLCMSSRP